MKEKKLMYSKVVFFGLLIIDIIIILFGNPKVVYKGFIGVTSAFIINLPFLIVQSLKNHWDKKEKRELTEKTLNSLIGLHKNETDCTFFDIFVEIRKKIDELICNSNFKDYCNVSSQALLLCVLGDYYLSKVQVDEDKKAFLYKAIKNDFKTFNLNQYHKSIEIYKEQIRLSEEESQSVDDRLSALCKTFFSLLTNSPETTTDNSRTPKPNEELITSLQFYLSVVIDVLNSFFKTNVQFQKLEKNNNNIEIKPSNELTIPKQDEKEHESNNQENKTEELNTPENHQNNNKNLSLFTFVFVLALVFVVIISLTISGNK